MFVKIVWVKILKEQHCFLFCLLIVTTMVSKSSLGILVGICGTLFIGYCVYFDRQRRNDPNFKKKLKERRKAKKAAEAARSSARPRLPNFEDHEAVQRFFLEQLQLGEELLGQGDTERGIEHLGTAVAVCHRPEQILHVLQQTLPPHVFNLFIQRLPMVGQKIMSEQRTRELIEDDIE